MPFHTADLCDQFSQQNNFQIAMTVHLHFYSSQKAAVLELVFLR